MTHLLSVSLFRRAQVRLNRLNLPDSAALLIDLALPTRARSRVEVTAVAERLIQPVGCATSVAYIGSVLGRMCHVCRVCQEQVCRMDHPCD